MIINGVKIKSYSKKSRRGFSMIEMMMVIGILGILVAVGATSFVGRVNRDKVNSASQIISSHLTQARQSAIAIRQSRRVVINAGSLEGFADGVASGYRSEPVTIWIEGKSCQDLPYSEPALCRDRRGTMPNAFPLSDPEILPDGVMIGDIDGLTPGVNDYPSTFYIEFNPRGAVRNVYFEGEETTTTPNTIAPVIHIARDGEVFELSTTTADYFDFIQNQTTSNYEWRDYKTNKAFERYKVHTIEVIRLTGRTRLYDYGVLPPYLLDHPVESSESTESGT